MFNSVKSDLSSTFYRFIQITVLLFTNILYATDSFGSQRSQIKWLTCSRGCALFKKRWVSRLRVATRVCTRRSTEKTTTSASSAAFAHLSRINHLNKLEY